MSEGEKYDENQTGIWTINKLLTVTLFKAEDETQFIFQCLSVLELDL